MKSIINDTTVFESQKEIMKKLLLLNIKEATARLIRRDFDNAAFASTCKACIETAKYFELNDLAEEMESDFKELHLL